MFCLFLPKVYKLKNAYDRITLQPRTNRKYTKDDDKWLSLSNNKRTQGYTEDFRKTKDFWTLTIKTKATHDKF